MNQTFKEILLDRRSIRAYKPGIVIEDTLIESIFKDALRAPSANNLQPWSFKIIKSPEAKTTYSHLFPWNRKQYETSSFMVILFVDKSFAKRAKAIYDMQVNAGTMTIETRDKQLNAFKQTTMADADILRTAYLDAGLVAMSLMLSARSYGLDTCPIGGFLKRESEQAFEVTDQEAVMAISFGIKDEDGHQTLRLPFHDVASIY